MPRFGVNKKGVTTTIHSAPQRSALSHNSVQPNKAYLPSDCHTPHASRFTQHPASKSVAAQVNPRWWSATPHPLLPQTREETDQHQLQSSGHPHPSVQRARRGMATPCPRTYVPLDIYAMITGHSFLLHCI